MKEPPKHVSAWISLLIAICSGIGAIWGAGRYYENKILKLKDYEDSTIQVKTALDSILSMTQRNTIAIEKMNIKVEKQGTMQIKFFESYKQYLRESDDVNKEMYSKLTDGVNVLTEEVKKKDF